MSKHTYQHIYTSETDYYISQTHDKLKKPRKVSADHPDYMEALASGKVMSAPYVAPLPPKDVPLDDLKQAKIRDLANGTSHLMADGFEFDGHTFSLSQSDMGDWSWLAIYDSLGKLTFPRGVSTKDGGEYIIPTKRAFSQWCDAGIGKVLAIKDGERALRVAVLAAVDEAGVEAAVDNL